VGKITASFAAPLFPKYVLLIPLDAVIGFVSVLAICAITSLVAIRVALKVDPAEAIGG
jgi:putative ABC transport system permease protein